MDRVIRPQFGSPNFIAAMELCNFQKDHGHALTFGRPLGTPDYANADLIVLWGHNPARTWLTQANAISARRPATTLVVIDPQRSGSGQQAGLWLGVRPGSDAALALGAIHHLIEHHRYNTAFVRDWTDATLLVDCETGRKLRADAIGGSRDCFVAIDAHGVATAVDTRKPVDPSDHPALFFDATLGLADGRRLRCKSVFSLLAENVASWTIERVAHETGLLESDVATFDALLASAGRASYFLWTGTAQGPTATQTTRAIASLFALRDNVDQVGGNRWLGSVPTRHLPMPAPNTRALGSETLPLGPPRHGHVTVADFCAAVETRQPYPVRAVVAFGTNLLASHPGSQRTAAALAALDFQVQCDLFMNPTASLADIVLPVTLPWEHDALRIGFEISEAAASHVQLRPRLIAPRGDQWPDYAIVRALATRLGFDHPVWNGPIETAWDWMLSPVGLDCASLRACEGGTGVAIDHPVAAYRTPHVTARSTVSRLRRTA